MKIFYITDTGSKHSENQDSYFYSSSGLFGKKHILCVADGMGGYADGKKSSSAVVTEISQATEQSGDISAIDEAIIRAHRKIVRSNDANRQYSGSTVAVAVVQKDAVVIKNVGDSKVVIVEKDSEKVVSVDDSVVNAMVLRGEITAEQAKKHPKNNVLTQCIGIGDTPQIHTGVITKPAAAAVCVMSDGACNRTRQGELSSLVQQLKKEGQTALGQFVDTLRSRGERDDITLLVLC